MRDNNDIAVMLITNLCGVEADKQPFKHSQVFIQSK